MKDKTQNDADVSENLSADSLGSIIIAYVENG